MNKLLTAAVATALVAAGSAAQAQELRIGHINTLTGPQSLPGIENMRGFMLGLESVGWKKNGDKVGGLPTNVYVEDDQGKPDVGKAAALKLIQQDNVDIVTDAPQTGIWKMTADGKVEYSRFDYHRRAVSNEQEAFFLRITGADDYRYEGADLGILILRGRSMTTEFVLNNRARDWINGIVSYYQAKPLAAANPVPEAGAFKIL